MTTNASRIAVALAGAAMLAGIAWAVATPAPAVPAGHARPAPLAAQNLLLAGMQLPGGTRLVAVGEYGHVLLSDDAGASWRQARSVPTVTTLTAVHFIDGQQGWAVGHGGVVIGTQDGGDTWQAMAGKLDGPEVLLSVWFADAQHGLVVGAFGHAARSSDGGRSWDRFDIAEGEDGERHLNQIFSAPGAAGGAATLWVAAEGGTLFRSDDGGAAWQAVKLPYKGSIWGGTALADRAGGGLLVWGMQGNALRSDDGGRSFTAVPTGTEQSLSGGAVLPGGDLVLAGLGGAVVRSSDGGRHFSPLARDDRAGIAAVLPGPTGRVLLLGQTGAQAQALAAAPAASAASAPR